MLSFITNCYAAKVSVIVNKIILLLIVAVITTKRGGIIKKGGRGGWEYLGPKILLTSIIFEIFHHIIISFCFFFPFSFPFLALPGNDSFRFPFPKCGNFILSFPSRSRILGMDFFIPIPFPNFGNGFFPFPSRSRIDPFKVGNQNGKWEILRDASIPTKKNGGAYFSAIFGRKFDLTTILRSC